MRKILLVLALSFVSSLAFADQYIIKYSIKGAGSTTHSTTSIELKNGTENEAKEALVKRGTVGKQNKDNITIHEIKKK